MHPPGSQEFQASAVAWLLDVLPEGYRAQQRVHRYPIGLAVIARHHAEACLDGARDGYRSIRAELQGWLSPPEVEAVLAVYATVGARHAATARAVGLVVEALHRDSYQPTRERRPGQRLTGTSCPPSKRRITLLLPPIMNATTCGTSQMLRKRASSKAAVRPWTVRYGQT